MAASPCAVVISVPAAILSALSAAARGGVLFKGGGALETLAKVKTFAFDKTGTLTTGKADVTRTVPLGLGDAELIALAAGVEAHSEHPIAAAVRRHAAARRIAPAEVTGVRSTPSEGNEGTLGAARFRAGNPRRGLRMGPTPGRLATTHSPNRPPG